MTKFAFTVKEEVAELKKMLATNGAWARRALVRVFEAQTQYEQNAAATLHHNGVGFTGSDAKVLTKIAKWYISKGSIDEPFMRTVHRRLPKYAWQIFTMPCFNHTQFDRILLAGRN